MKGKDFTKDFKIIHLNAGDNVVCDLCNKDYKNDPAEGGYIFMSNAVCPDCADEFWKGIQKYKEERYVKAWCPTDCSFYNFVLKYRKER